MKDMKSISSSKFKNIKYSIVLLFLFLSCRQNEKDTTAGLSLNSIKFDYDEYQNGIKLSETFDNIKFVELEKSFSPSKLPGVFKCRADKYFILWRFNKIGIYSKQGELLDSIVSEINTREYIGNIFDFEVTKDSIFVLTGDLIYVYELDNLESPIRKINLPDYFNTFTIYKNGFILYSVIKDHVLYYIDMQGTIIKKEFPTSQNYSALRPDFFPHFSYLEEKYTLFVRPYDPVLYKIQYENGNINKFISIDFGLYKPDLDEIRRSLGMNPGNISKELNVVHSMFNYFDDINILRDWITYSCKIKGKFFYNLNNEINKTKITFNHLLNDTYIPFMKDRQILDLIGTDNRNSLIFYLEPEFLLEAMTSGKQGRTGKEIRTNWFEINENISISSGPILAIMQLKDDLQY